MDGTRLASASWAIRSLSRVKAKYQLFAPYFALVFVQACAARDALRVRRDALGGCPTHEGGHYT